MRRYLTALIGLSVAGVAVLAAQSKPAVNPLKPTAAEVAEFRDLEVKLWETWNKRLMPIDARPFYSQDPRMLYFDFSPMKFTGWAEYERVATQAIGGSGHAETKINDDFTLIKNGDLAVTAFTFHVDFYNKQNQKQGNGMDARETDAWVRENGRWIVAHQHMSFPSGGGGQGNGPAPAAPASR